MGSISLYGMMEMGLNLETLLEWHLTNNHYPPIHTIFVPIAEKAIGLAKIGEWDKKIILPNGKSLTVTEIIEGLHLEDFLNHTNGNG